MSSFEGRLRASYLSKRTMFENGIHEPGQCCRHSLNAISSCSSAICRARGNAVEIVLYRSGMIAPVCVLLLLLLLKLLLMPLGTLGPVLRISAVFDWAISSKLNMGLTAGGGGGVGCGGGGAGAGAGAVAGAATAAAAAAAAYVLLPAVDLLRSGATPCNATWVVLGAGLAGSDSAALWRPCCASPSRRPFCVSDIRR